MPPKRESKKVKKVDKVEEVLETVDEVVETGIKLNDIINPINTDTKETTKTKKITIKKNEKTNSINNLDSIINTDTNTGTSTESILIKKKKTNKIIFEKSEDEIKNSLKSESFKKKFLDFLNEMHNLLRGCAVTGDPALDDILNTLFLCYIEDKITDKDKFDFENSDKECYQTISKKVKDYSKYLKINYLIEHIEEFKKNEGSLNSIEKCAKLLSLHPTTKLLFKGDNFINCKDPLVFSELLRKCKNFSKEQNIFENIDIAGIAYEYMSTKHAGNGGISKEMGQYFTERLLMFILFQLIDKEDIDDLGINNNSTIGDEFCATFGFPLMAKKFLKEKFNIDIKDKNMYGIEYHERLSRFAIMNAMFSMTNFENITRADSFITNVTPHLDLSIHNVPFGKSMYPEIIKQSYNNFLEENPNKGYPELKNYIPFCNKKIDAILASQVVLYKTKKMGLMIIKDGEETSGKSNSEYRKWFSENCIIKKIIKIPSGSFTFTKGTKTVCIYFIKKEGKMTENIKFLEIIDNGNKINEICNVSMDDLKNNNYSWDSNAYIIDEEMERIMAKSNCEWKKLGDISIMLPTTKHYTSIGKKKGLYRFYNSSQKDKLYIDTYEINKESIIFGNGGELCIHYDTQFTASKHVTIIQSIININLKYIYYYLLFNIDNIKIKSTGGGIQWFNKEKISNIMIPMPSIELQNEIVENIEKINLKQEEYKKEIKKLEESKVNLLEQSYEQN